MSGDNIRTDYLLSICDDTGLLQHAVHSVGDRHHGYCVDDNARALLLACELVSRGEAPLPPALTGRFAAFVQHAWNPSNRRFRNFMGFDRRWREDMGSEDSHGRTLWALGAASRTTAPGSLRPWARALFAQAAPIVADFTSPRAWAFALLGLEGFLADEPAAGFAQSLRRDLVSRLTGLLGGCESPDWVWFEDGLAYDNARLPQSLIVSGVAMGAPKVVVDGLRSLRWLTDVQTSPAGQFRPVGSDSFGDRRCPPRLFDQQPLEALATISACRAAWRADGGNSWRDHAQRAFAWFHGENDLAVTLVDAETGSCRDGLHPDRANENRGAESVLSYLLGQVEMHGFAVSPALVLVAGHA